MHRTLPAGSSSTPLPGYMRHDMTSPQSGLQTRLPERRFAPMDKGSSRSIRLDKLLPRLHDLASMHTTVPQFDCCFNIRAHSSCWLQAFRIFTADSGSIITVLDFRDCSTERTRMNGNRRGPAPPDFQEASGLRCFIPPATRTAVWIAACDHFVVLTYRRGAFHICSPINL